MSLSWDPQPAGHFVLLVPEPVESVSLRGLPLLQMADHLLLHDRAPGAAAGLRDLRFPWIPGQTNIRSLNDGTEVRWLAKKESERKHGSEVAINEELGHPGDKLSTGDYFGPITALFGRR